MLTSTLSFSWSSLISAILAGEVGEGTVLDPDRVTDLVLEAWLGAMFLTLDALGSHLEDRLHLGPRLRCRVGSRTHEIPSPRVSGG